MRRALAAVFAIALLIPAGVAGAYDLNDQLDNINRRIDSISEQIAAANSSRSTVVADIVATRDALALRQAALAATEDDLADTERQRGDRQADLDDLRVQLQQSYQSLAETRIRLDDTRDEAKALVRAAYVGTTDGRESVTFGADSVTSVYVGLQYLSILAADSDRAMLAYESLQTQEERQQIRIEADEADVADQVVELEAIEADLAVLVEEQAEKADAVAADLADLAAKLDGIDASIAEFSDELDGLEQEQARVERLIEQEASKEGTAPGVLVRPVPGSVTSSFGMRVHPILGYARMHTGIDMSAPYGQQIQAAGSGRVILAGVYGGYGNTVILDHGGGMTTLYAHQSQLNVSYGQEVAAADIIGYIGTSGLSTGPHLHFEVRISGKPVNPLDYL
jgi:murein DD-endopeptidase MepM/ murein hydrolase activator NlpD